MRQRNRLAIAAVLTCTAALTAGCGGSATNEPSAALEGRGPITFVAGKDEESVNPKIVEAWNKAHPDEQVRFIELSSSADDQRQQMVQNAQTKSDAFTVLDLDNVWTAEFAANRWITALPQEQFGIDQFVPTSRLTDSHSSGYASRNSASGGSPFSHSRVCAVLRWVIRPARS